MKYLSQFRVPSVKLASVEETVTPDPVCTRVATAIGDASLRKYVGEG